MYPGVCMKVVNIKNLHTLHYINRSFEIVHLFITIFATKYRYGLAQAYAYSDSKVKSIFLIVNPSNSSDRYNPK